jgi:D-arginine dehydrogenase
LAPLPMLHIALPGRGALIQKQHEAVRTLVPDVELLDAAETERRQPLLRPGSVDCGLLEPGAMEIDVHALHQHFLHGLRDRGGTVHAGARVVGARHDGTYWNLDTADGAQWRAATVIDAAGAWADDIAEVFGAAPIGLRALRRTAFIVDAPAGAGAPMIADIDDTFYVKPDAGRLLCSPADETPQPPRDARPDELEIDRAIDVINTVTTLDIRHVRAAWAGLRNFVADRTPVAGYDERVPGFFWYAGQGGYGIQTSAAFGRVAGALVRGRPVPDDVARLGVAAADLAPRRPALESAADAAG